MKKILALASMVALALTCLVACGEDMSDSPYLGDWTATTAEYSGIELGVSDVLGGDMTFTLESNGDCVLDVAGEEYNGKWAETETGVILDDEFDVTITGEQGVMEYDGVTFHFQHQ